MPATPLTTPLPAPLPASRPADAAPPAAAVHAPGGIGALLRHWRTRRRLSQLDLALTVGVSPRHLSFVETGRSRPSAPMVLALARALALPLRERNRLLLAAGHAPRFAQRDLAGAAELAPVRAALARLLAAHQPFPGLVLDRQWNVLLANPAAQALVALLPAALAGPPLNVFRASLHPEGFASRTVNFAQWAPVLLETLGRAAADGDAGLVALRDEVAAYPTVQALRAQGVGAPDPDAPPPLLVPCVLDLPVGRVSLFTTLTAFGTPQDITLDELCVELFYPADEASRARLAGAATGDPA